MIGYIVASAIQIYFSIVISSTVDYKKNVTYLGILLSLNEMSTRVRTFLVILFFAFSFKIGVYIMIAKRGLFDFLVEFVEEGMEYQVYRRMTEMG